MAITLLADLAVAAETDITELAVELAVVRRLFGRWR
jgi:hypothetical protein